MFWKEITQNVITHYMKVTLIFFLWTWHHSNVGKHLFQWQHPLNFVIIKQCLCYHCLCVYVYVHVCTHAFTHAGCVWKPKNNLVKLVLSFHLYTGSRDQSQGVRLAQQAMSHWPISLFLTDKILKCLGAKKHKSPAFKNNSSESRQQNSNNDVLIGD